MVWLPLPIVIEPDVLFVRVVSVPSQATGMVGEASNDASPLIVVVSCPEMDT